LGGVGAFADVDAVAELGPAAGIDAVADVGAFAGATDESRPAPTLAADATLPPAAPRRATAATIDHDQRHRCLPNPDAVWELRNTISAYDVTYVALAEYVDCALVTADARLSRATGARCAVTVVPR
jgi:hypothetical protein